MGETTMRFARVSLRSLNGEKRAEDMGAEVESGVGERSTAFGPFLAFCYYVGRVREGVTWD
jgi:hypothetical protein